MGYWSPKRGSSSSSSGDGVWRRWRRATCKYRKVVCNTGMPHQALDGVEIHPGFQEMGGEGVAE